MQELEETTVAIVKAEEDSRNQQTQDAGIAGARFLDNLVTRSKSDLQKAKEIAEVRRQTTAAIMANPLNSAAYEQQEKIALAEIEKKFKPKAEGGRSTVDVSEYKRNLAALNDAFKNSQQILESERRAGLVDEESYWKKNLSNIAIAQLSRQRSGLDVTNAFINVERPGDACHTARNCLIQLIFQDCTYGNPIVFPAVKGSGCSRTRRLRGLMRIFSSSSR